MILIKCILPSEKVEDANYNAQFSPMVGDLCCMEISVVQVLPTPHILLFAEASLFLLFLNVRVEKQNIFKNFSTF